MANNSARKTTVSARKATNSPRKATNSQRTTTNSAPKTTHRNAVERIREAESFAMDLPVVGHVRIPRPEHLAFYGALTALAVLEIIDWPVALVLGAGHALAQKRHSQLAQELGEALEEA